MRHEYGEHGTSLKYTPNLMLQLPLCFSAVQHIKVQTILGIKIHERAKSSRKSGRIVGSLSFVVYIDINTEIH